MCHCYSKNCVLHAAGRHLALDVAAAAAAAPAAAAAAAAVIAGPPPRRRRRRCHRNNVGTANRAGDDRY